MLFVTLFLKQAQVPGHIVEKLKKFDWLGSVLFSAGSASFLFGLTAGGVRYPWYSLGLSSDPAQVVLTRIRASYQALLPLIIGLSAMVSFVYWEFNFASEPIVDKRIFKTWTAVSTYIQTMLHGLVLWAAIYFLSKITSYPVLTGNLPLPSIELTICYSLVLSSRQIVLASHFSNRPIPRNGGPIPLEHRCRSSHR